jgi:hypothetical protein
VRRLPRDYAGNTVARHWKTPLPSLSLALFLSHSLSHGWLGRTALSPSHSFLFLVWFGLRKHNSPLFLTLGSGWARGKQPSFFSLLPLPFSIFSFSRSHAQQGATPPLQLSSPFQSLFDFTKGREQHAPCCLYNGGKGPHFLHE